MKELREMFRYVDRHGIPSKVGQIPGRPFPREDAVLVPIPTRVLRALRTVMDGPALKKAGRDR